MNKGLSSEKKRKFCRATKLEEECVKRDRTEEEFALR